MERKRGALDSVQHRLWQLITSPSGVEAADESDPERGSLASLVCGSDAAPAAERVAVYANAYFARLHDCLREDFGALARALGEAAFHDLVKTYLMMHPPSQPSLRHAGAHLAEHLSTPPFAEIFARRCAYAADLARLEWALAEAFTAPDAPTLGHADLAALPPDAWAALRFEPAPALRLLRCAWPVEIARERFECLDAGCEGALLLDAEETHIRVWRREEQVRYARITPLELEMLAGLSRGEPFAALCERAASDVDDAAAAAQAAAYLASWVAEGLLARIVRD
jgi:hypothetical protein